MFEQLPESSGTPSALKILGGFVIGVVVSCVGLVIIYVGAAALTSVVVPHARGQLVVWATEVLDIAVFTIGGYSIYREVGSSDTGRGLLIGISFVFLLNAICGVAMLTSHGSLF